jgi:hypothetical protein
MGPAEFTARVQKDARIAPNHGPTFGTGGESFLRFNFATPRARVEEAVRRLQASLRRPAIAQCPLPGASATSGLPPEHAPEHDSPHQPAHRRLTRRRRGSNTLWTAAPSRQETP